MKRESTRSIGTIGIAWCVPVLLSVLPAMGLSAADAPSAGRRRARTARETITPEVRHSATRAMNFLVRRQADTNDFRNSTHPVAITSLTGLALLASGVTEESGAESYVHALRRCTTVLLSYQNPLGYFNDGGQSRMYGHGFATLYLAELYGMSSQRSDQVRSALRRAIRVIEKSQHGNGGWDYFPGPAFGGTAPKDSDTSITVCQTMGLRAARNLGLNVDAGVIKRATEYIRKAQKPDGSFRYRASGSHEFNAFPRSAAGVCILYSLGEYSSSNIQSGIRYLEKNYKKSTPFTFYAQYYCSQAMFQVGEPRWKRYYTWARDRLLETQKSDGSWRSAGPLKIESSPDQTTAMALIVMQLPYRLLPIHER